MNEILYWSALAITDFKGRRNEAFAKLKTDIHPVFYWHAAAITDYYGMRIEAIEKLRVFDKELDTEI